MRRLPVATATIAYAETYSGLTRRYREGTLTRSDYERVCEQFEHDWVEILRVPLGDVILGTARTMIQRHVLRGFDAIHLASALSLQTELNEVVTLAAADERLLQAAAAEGLPTLNVETGRGAPKPTG